MKKWKRLRFWTAEQDYRPVVFPPPGPWWCSGTTFDTHNSKAGSWIVCFLPIDTNLHAFWPDAAEVSDTGTFDKIEFTDRFPRPDWFHNP